MQAQEQGQHDFLAVMGTGLLEGFFEDMGACVVHRTRKVPDKTVLPRKWSEGKGCVCFASRQVTESPVDLASSVRGRVMQGFRRACADSRNKVLLKWHLPIRGERAWAHGFFLRACPSCTFQESNIPGSRLTCPSQGSWRPSPGSAGSGVTVESAQRRHQRLTPRGQRSCMTSGVRG